MREAGVNLVTVGVFAWALAGARRGPVRVRLARPGARRAARRRHPGRPGHRHRLAAAVVLRGAPGDAAGRPRRAAARRTAAGRRTAPAPRRTGRPRVAWSSSSPPATRDHPALALWHVHNEYGCHNAALLLRRRPRRRSAPGCARRYARPGRAQRRLGHRVLVPALHRLGRRSSRPGPRRPSRTRRRCWTSAGSAPTSCWRASPPSATCCAGSTPDVPVTTNFMPGSHGPRLLGVGRGADRTRLVSNDHYLIADAPRRAAGPDRVRRRPGPLARRRRPVAADGALHQRGQLAAPQPRQAARAARPRQPRRTWPAAPRARCSSSGGPAGPARRSATRRWCRTPAPTRRSGARWSRSAPTCDALAEVAGARIEAPVARAAGLRERLGAGGRRPAERRHDRVRRGPALARARCGGPAHRRLRAPGGRPLRRTGWSSPRRCTWSTDADAANLAGYVAGGGTLVVGPTQRDRRRARPRAAGAAARRLRRPARRPGRGVLPAAGRRGPCAWTTAPRGQVWTEPLTAVDAEVLIRYADGPLAGGPALTRRRAGAARPGT